MIETKLFELRDKMTFIPILACRMSSDVPREQWLLRKAGYSETAAPLVLLTKLDGGKSAYEPYDWADRTYFAAHQHIAAHWGELNSGQLLDVRVILGEQTTPCASEEEAWR